MGNLRLSKTQESREQEGKKILMVYDEKKDDKKKNNRRDGAKRFCLERRALREIGEEVEKELGNAKITEYTLENHMFDDECVDFFEDECDTKKSLRKIYDVMILMQHDWPTVSRFSLSPKTFSRRRHFAIQIHENPVWCLRFLRLFKRCRRSIPSEKQTMYLFRKTSYWKDVLQLAEKIQCLPTFIVGSDTNLDILSKRLAKACRDHNTSSFVTKENFSAGKEGVRVFDFGSDVSTIRQVLDTTRRRIAATCWAAPETFGPSEFLVQVFEPRFMTEPEIRLYYICGSFEYAKTHVGTIQEDSYPVTISPEKIVKERAQAECLLMNLPRLKEYICLRFDFGPGSRLNEIEMYPDLFGGPGNEDSILKGDKVWNAFKTKVCREIIKQALLLIT